MRYLLQLLFIVCTANFLCAESIGTGDFAAGYYLEVTGEGPIYSLEIPEEVYRKATRADLGDIRVFNNAGEVVPHGLKKAKGDPEAGRTREPVAFFPMYEGMAGKVVAGMSVQVGVSGVGKSIDGTIVRIDPAPSEDNSKRKPMGYLLDVSGLKSAPKTLEFQWTSDSQSSVVKVKLQQSDDLVAWSQLVQKATLADLNYGGYKVQRNTIRLPYPPKKYLKLTWQEDPGNFLLTGAVGVSEIVPSRLQRQWISLNLKTAAKDKGTLLLDFNSRYHLPADGAQLNFSQSNSLARVSLSSRPDEESQWQTRCRQLFYNLNLEGESLQNEPCMFSPRSDSYWRLAIEEDGAGLGESGNGLGLQLGWTPSELYFVGRGSPPYLLAFGSGKLQGAETGVDSQLVLQAMETAVMDQSIKRAVVGKRIELGGEQALQPPSKGLPWKKLLLWGVLALGVGVLAFMARSLVQEMKVSKGDNESSQE